MIEENNENERKPKKIEIVKGNSKDLNISNVKDSLIIEKPEILASTELNKDEKFVLDVF